MSQAPPRIETLDHLVLTVSDIPATVAFYRDVLGMTEAPFQTATGETRMSLTFGTMKINLHQAGRAFEPKAMYPTPGSADLCFLTEQPIEDWVTQLAAHGVALEDGPVPRTGATGPLTSIYLRDPDQNLIELSNRR